MPIPKPRAGESERAFLDRCIPTQVDEGKPRDQASAICFRSFREGNLQEDDDLPVLELSGVDYALMCRASGAPGAVVVEDPDAYKGKRFRFAEGDGFSVVTLGEAHGPYHALMALPPHVIKGLDVERLRDLADKRDLYVVELTEAVKLQEQGETEEAADVLATITGEQLDAMRGLTLGELAMLLNPPEDPEESDGNSPQE